MTEPLILFGGTFDPVHRAHISGALAVSRYFDGATVELMPNALPPHRDQPGASPQDRLAMLELACDPHPQLTVNDWELKQEGPSWTRLTLDHWRSQIGQRPLVLVVGADSLASLPHWRDWQAFPGLYHLAVLPRPDAPRPPAEVLTAFAQADPTAICQSPAGLRLMLPEPFLDISATTVRKQLAEKGHSSSLDEKVMAHIRAHGLYNVGKGSPGRGPDHHRNHNGDA